MTITHRMTGTPLHYVWKAMRQRCSNSRNKNWMDYGGRGIQVCRAWEDFVAFYEWAMLAGYQEGLLLDRKRSSGNYCPSNCRWATRSVQSQNRRKSNGKSSRYLGVSWDSTHGYWVAYVKLHGKQKTIGRFHSEQAAAKARDAYIKVHYDAFATRNF